MQRVAAALSALSFGLLCACTGGEPRAANVASIERACAGLPDAIVDRTLAELRANVERVESLRDGRTKLTPHTIGAVVQIRTTPGMTAEWIERVLRCDAARQGPTATCTLEGCPLGPAGATRDVTSTPAGFAIALRSRDLDVAQEIDRRARAFARQTPP